MGGSAVSFINHFKPSVECESSPPNDNPPEGDTLTYSDTMFSMASEDDRALVIPKITTAFPSTTLTNRVGPTMSNVVVAAVDEPLVVAPLYLFNCVAVV